MSIRIQQYCGHCGMKTVPDVAYSSSSQAPSLGTLYSVQWLAVSIHICICETLSKPLRRELYQAPVSKHFLTSAIVSGFGVCMWNRFPGGSVSGWSFFQSLLHTSFLYIRFRGSVHYHQGSRTWQHPGRQDELRVLHLVPKANRRLTSPYKKAT